VKDPFGRAAPIIMGSHMSAQKSRPHPKLVNAADSRPNMNFSGLCLF
jgi:hypothetical protein